MSVQKNNIIIVILASIVLSGYTLELPEPLDVNDGVEVGGVEVFIMILSNLSKANIVLTLPILGDSEYVLYPKDIILEQFSNFPNPNRFMNNEYSNCNHIANFYKILSQQTMPGAPCIYIAGIRFTETGIKKHAWLGILSMSGEIVMFSNNSHFYPIIQELNAS